MYNKERIFLMAFAKKKKNSTTWSTLVRFAVRARIISSADFSLVSRERILLARTSLAVFSAVPRASSATTAIPLTNDAIKGALTYNFPWEIIGDSAPGCFARCLLRVSAAHRERRERERAYEWESNRERERERSQERHTDVRSRLAATATAAARWKGARGIASDHEKEGVGGRGDAEVLNRVMC